MGNPYLDSLQDRYNALKAGIEGLQNRAVEEERDLTEDELRAVKEQSDEAKTLATQIEDLSEIEQRNAKVAGLAASLLTTGGDGDGKADQKRSAGGAQTRGTALGITAQERDPGHYVRSGEHSFFGDLYRSKTFDDQDARLRLTEHQRALSTGAQGAGVVPPHWLTEEFETIARQGRVLANAVRPIPLGDDPRPLTLPKQTGETDVEDQVNENDPIPDSTPGWDSDVDTVAPKATSGKQIVSRQMVDMSSPAIDMLLYGDLLGVYNEKVEAKVATAVLAAGPAALPAQENGAATTTPINVLDDVHFANVAIDAAIAVRDSRKMPANIVAMSVGRWGKFKKLRDLDGRPLIPSGSGQAVNVNGVGSVNVDGVYEDLGIVATDGFPNAATFAVIRSTDILLFESNLLRFRFEEQAGPESIVLGVWGYTAVLVRQGGKCVQRVAVTDAP